MKELIYRLIETSMDDVIKDTIELVNIKSVQASPVTVRLSEADLVRFLTDSSE